MFDKSKVHEYINIAMNTELPVKPEGELSMSAKCALEDAANRWCGYADWRKVLKGEPQDDISIQNR